MAEQGKKSLKRWALIPLWIGTAASGFWHVGLFMVLMLVAMVITAVIWESTEEQI